MKCFCFELTGLTIWILGGCDAVECVLLRNKQVSSSLERFADEARRWTRSRPAQGLQSSSSIASAANQHGHSGPTISPGPTPDCRPTQTSNMGTSPKICPRNLQQPTLNPQARPSLDDDDHDDTTPSTNPPPPNHQSKWVVFTPTEREFQPRLSPTAAAPPRGSRPPRTRSSTRSASWPRRAPPLPRSVSSCVTPTESPRSRSSPVCCLSRWMSASTGA